MVPCSCKKEKDKMALSGQIVLFWIIAIGFGFNGTGVAYNTIMLKKNDRPKVNKSEEKETEEDVEAGGHPQELCSTIMSEPAHFIVFFVMEWLAVFAVCSYYSYSVSENAAGYQISNINKMNASFDVGVLSWFFAQALLFLYYKINYYPDFVGKAHNFSIAIIPAVLNVLLAICTFICFILALTWSGISNHIFNQWYLWFLPFVTYIPYLLYSAYLVFVSFSVCWNGNNYGKDK